MIMEYNTSGSSTIIKNLKILNFVVFGIEFVNPYVDIAAAARTCNLNQKNTIKSQKYILTDSREHVLKSSAHFEKVKVICKPPIAVKKVNVPKRTKSKNPLSSTDF